MSTNNISWALQIWATKHFEDWQMICQDTDKGITAIEYIRLCGALHLNGFHEIRMAFTTSFGYLVGHELVGTNPAERRLLKWTQSHPKNWAHICGTEIGEVSLKRFQQIQLALSEQRFKQLPFLLLCKYMNRYHKK